MKKKVLCLWLCLFLLTGCHLVGKSAKVLPQIPEETSNQRNDYRTDSENIQNIYTIEDNAKAPEKSVIEEQESFYDNLNTSYYYYDGLDAEEKKLYNEIYAILIQRLSDVTVSTKEAEQLDRVYNMCMRDHPEFFYSQGYSFTKHTKNDVIQSISFSPNYTYSEKEVNIRKEAIDQYVNHCLSSLSAESDEYEKVKYVYDYIVKNTTYETQAPDNQNICSVFLNGVSVCQGYAKATQYLLQHLGIQTTLVTGTIQKTGEGHAWNLVRIDGDYYYVDTTWGDASYTQNAESHGTEYPEVTYDYLNITTEELSRTHSISEIMSLPVCDSKKANYYVREGLYFNQLDKDQLTFLFRRAYETSDSYLSIKCADPKIFDTLEDYLLTRQKIFEYLIDNDTVVYLKNEDLFTWTFWL